MIRLLSIVCFLFLGLESRAGGPPPRWVVLSPDLMEWIQELGGEVVREWIVGQAEPKVVPALFDVASVGAFHQPNFEAILARKPDLVLVSKNGNPAQIVKRLNQASIRSEVFDSRTLLELRGVVQRLSELLNQRERAQEWLGRIDRILARTGREAKRNCVAIIGLNPLVVSTGRTFIGEILKSNGCRIFPEATISTYPTLQKEALLSKRGGDWYAFGAMSGVEDLSELKRLAQRSNAKLISIEKPEALRPSPWLVREAADHEATIFQ